MREISESILDILMNAAEAGARKVTLELFFSEREDMLGFEVCDDGRGIPREAITQVTDPFFSTGDGRGAGLGLSLLKSEAEQAGGGIRITSGEGQGTRVRAWYQASSLDTPPVGDIAGTAALFLSGRPDMSLVCRCRSDTRFGEFSSGELPDGGEPFRTLRTARTADRMRELTAEIIQGK